MPTERLTWDHLPTEAHVAIEAQIGPVIEVQDVSTGFNSELAVIVRASSATLFVKGLRANHPRAWTQHTEASVGRLVSGVSPKLHWHLVTAGWLLLGFDYLAGRHVDYAPGSADLPLVVRCISQMRSLDPPDLPLKRAEDRLRTYTDTPEAADAFRGTALLHTDWNSKNVLITDRAYVVDWAWATIGAAWLDPAYWVIWLIAEGGHQPADAEHWASQVPSWATAPTEALNAFASANAQLWNEIASADADDWSASVASAAIAWANHRTAITR